MIRSTVGRIRSRIENVIWRRPSRLLDVDLSLTEALVRFPNPNLLYRYMHVYFWRRVPGFVREHRRHFRRGRRGFGEDAFHAMWWLLFRQYRPRLAVEIGVYRGQVISLWSLIARHLGFQCEVHGISPLSATGDEFGGYDWGLDYESEVRDSFRRFGLPEPVLLKALSTEEKARRHLSEHTWDLVYIDGSHDLDVVLSDYQAAREGLRPGGILVMDDASLGTEFRPPSFSFGGHSGPSEVVRRYGSRDMKLLGAVGHNVILQEP